MTTDTTPLIRLPLHFYMDHFERNLPTPDDVRITKAHVWVRASDAALGELLSDAQHYAHPSGPDNCSRRLVNSAKATVRLIEAALIPPPPLPRWACPECKSTKVQISLPTWYRETTDGTLEMVEADSGADVMWWSCDDCNETDNGSPTDLKGMAV